MFPPPLPPVQRNTLVESKKHFPLKIDFFAPDVEKRLSRVKKQFFKKCGLSRNPLGEAICQGSKKDFP